MDLSSVDHSPTSRKISSALEKTWESEGPLTSRSISSEVAGVGRSEDGASTRICDRSVELDVTTVEIETDDVGALKALPATNAALV
jgi:hypothetical protein